MCFLALLMLNINNNPFLLFDIILDQGKQTMNNNDDNVAFTVVLVALPLSLLIGVGPFMGLMTYAWFYFCKSIQKRKAKHATILFSQSGCKLLNFYRRYDYINLVCAMTGVAAFSALGMYGI